MAEQLPEPFKLTWEDKFEKAKTYKNEGNERFKAKQHKPAIGKYHRALLYLKGIDASKQGSLMPSVFGDRDVEVKMSEDIQEEFVQLKADCYNNLAACILQTESPVYEKVLQYCDEVLQLSPNNVKATYRKGVALYNLSRLDDALEELVKAQHQPTGMKDPNIKRHIKLCQQRAQLQNKTLRQKYRAMFERMAWNETPVNSETSVHSNTSVASDMSVCVKSSTSGEDVTIVDRPSSTITEDVTIVDKPCSTVIEDVIITDRPSTSVTEDVIANRPCSSVTEDVTVVKKPCSSVIEDVTIVDKPCSACQDVTIVDKPCSICQDVTIVNKPCIVIEDVTVANRPSSTVTKDVGEFEISVSDHVIRDEN